MKDGHLIRQATHMMHTKESLFS